MSRALYLQFFPSLDSIFIADTELPPIFDNGGVPIPPTTVPMNYLVRGTVRLNNTNLLNTKYPALAFSTYDNPTQYPSQFAWTKVRRILLSSTSIQVNPEQIGASGKDGRPFFENILTDFELPVENSALNRTTIYYQPSVFRYISILSDSEIRKMDLRIYFQDYDTLAIHPLEIPPHHDVNVKLQFRRIRQNENLLTRLVSVFQKGQTKSEVNESITSTPKTKNQEAGYSVQLPASYVHPSGITSTPKGGFSGIRY